MTLYITEADVGTLLPIPAAIGCVEQAFRDRETGQAIDVPRERTKTTSGTMHVLQAASYSLGLIGLKVYFPGRTARTFLVHLIELETGRLLALIEADEMGIRRTGAATSVATRALSRPASKVVACFGSGRHAVTQLQAVAAVRDIRQARVFGRDPQRLARFKEAVEQETDVNVTIAETREAALNGADIVNIVTRSDTPLFDGRLLAPGQHVNAVGSNALHRREIDLEAIHRCDRIVVDSAEVARRECGDLLPAVEAGLIHWNNVIELGAVLEGVRPGRISDSDITLFESQGMGMQDIYVGKHVLDEARRRGMGKELPIG